MYFSYYFNFPKNRTKVVIFYKIPSVFVEKFIVYETSLTISVEGVFCNASLYSSDIIFHVV